MIFMDKKAQGPTFWSNQNFLKKGKKGVQKFLQNLPKIKKI